ncbi:hypothetical protein J4477_01960 [Candidatus Pacearchaeota archaeon]|nr:hypothetical protein [Candidatus Pacearchaeota archaeon]
MVLNKLKRVKQIRIRPPSQESVQLWTLLSLIILFLIGILVLNSMNILNKIQTTPEDNKFNLKSYTSYSSLECARIQIDCALGYEEFKDSSGCGCMAVNERIIGNNVTLCTEKEKTEKVCIVTSKPVCGFKQVECIKAPCYPIPEDYENNCEACTDERVLYYINGECSDKN